MAAGLLASCSNSEETFIENGTGRGTLTCTVAHSTDRRYGNKSRFHSQNRLGGG